MKKRRIDCIYEVRPLRENDSILRYDNGNWIKDDGKFGIAFADMAEGRAYGVSMPYYANILWSWCELGLWRRLLPEHPRGNAWHYMYIENTRGEHWEQRYNHINVKAQEEAMHLIAEKKGCSSGWSAEFYIGDPYINAGKLRIKETKKIIKFPIIFDCIYCGKIDWRRREKELKKKLGNQ